MRSSGVIRIPESRLLKARGTKCLRRDVSLCGCLAVGLSLIGCAATPAPLKPKMLLLDVSAAANVNPDARGRPSPVLLRIYELKSAAPFEAADFVALYEKDQSILGAEIVVRDELTLSPGESRSVRREAGASKYLAVMAAFRDLERARWRAVSPLTPGGDNAFAIQLDAATLQLTKR